MDIFWTFYLNHFSPLWGYFFSYDLNLDPMTLILKLDLDMVKIYMHTKNEVSMWRSSKVIAWIDRQTHRHDWKYYLPRYCYKFIPNITKLFKAIWTMEASFSKPLQTTQPIRMQGQQKCCHLLEKKGAYPMRMQDFQTQQIPHATEAIRM